MSSVSYATLVQETLAEKWGELTSPLNRDDLTAGIALFTAIAIKAIKTDLSSGATESSDHSFSAEEPVGATAGKIKDFVEENAFAFWQACETGFPFSRLEGPTTEAALEHALTHYDSMLSSFMTLATSEGVGEEELARRFSDSFRQIPGREIGKACSDLKRAYLREGDKKAGYCLLWLIKQATGCSYTIPEEDSFQASTVTDVLSQVPFEKGSLANPTNLVEILCHQSGRLEHLYTGFLNQESRHMFLSFVFKQLRETPIDQWPGKGPIITGLLERLTSESKLDLAWTLASSEDVITARIGDHLLAAFTACSFREAIPHFNGLIELMPHLNHTHIQIIFGRPFPEFRYGKSIYKNVHDFMGKDDPDFTRRLRFNELRKVFVHGSLMMGVHDPHITFGNTQVFPHLLAYDMDTEKMVWGIRLTPTPPADPSLDTTLSHRAYGIPRMQPADYKLNLVGEQISLEFAGEKKMFLIHPETGELSATVELPEASLDRFDRLHIDPNGFAYQMVHKGRDRILVGGRVIDGQWNPSFEAKTPDGLFVPLSTHCGFSNGFKDEWVVFGPKGDQILVKNCLAAQAKGDTLCLVEKDPTSEEKCILTVNTLKMDPEVFKTEKTIPLNTKSASFGNVCQNGQLILFSDSFSHRSPIFVYLKSGEITYSTHPLPSYAKSIINPVSGELWTWDELSTKIWKVSAAGATLMGSLGSGRGTSLLHVDENDHLYFVDIPF